MHCLCIKKHNIFFDKGLLEFLELTLENMLSRNLLVPSRLQCVQQNVNFDPKQGHIPFYIKKGIRELLFSNGLNFTQHPP